MARKAQSEAKYLLSDISGRARLTLMGILACSLLIFGFILLLNLPAQAFVTKGTSCSAASCHGATNTGATISVALNGTQGTAITAAAGSTFEIDWMFTNMVYTTTKYDGVNPELAVPTGWTVARGTANSPSLTGWHTSWNQTDGVTTGWNITYSTATDFPNSPVGYSIDYNGTTWDSGNRNAAFDNGSAGDLDGVANKMGTDARITVPAGTSPGTYTVMVLGIGHDSGDTKAHIEQAITVTVPDTTAPTVNTFTMPSTASSLTVNVTAFTATDNVAVTGYKITESATAPLPGDADWTSSAPANFTFSSAGTKTAYAWAKDAAGLVSTARTATVTITIKQDQATLSVTGPSNITYGNTGQITYSGGSGTGAMSYSHGASTGCTVNTSTGLITVTNASNSCSVTATKAGDATYNPATSAPYSVTLNKAAQATLTVTSPADVTYGSTGQITTTGGTGTGAMSYSAGTSTGCSVNPSTGVVSVSDASGTCSVTATKATDSNYLVATSADYSVTLNKAAQATLTVTAPASVTYGSTGTLTSTGGSGSGAVTYSAGASTGCNITGGTTLNISDASGTCTVTATKAADTNYLVATSADYSVSLNKAAQATLSVTAPASVTYGSTGTLTSTGGSGSGAVTYSAGASTGCNITGGTTLNVSDASGTCTVTATKAADTNYLVATSADYSVTLNKAASNVTAWPAASAIAYGQTLASSILTGGASTPTGTFAFTNQATAPDAGTADQSVTFTPSDAANYNTATGTASVTVNKANQIITFDALANKTYGDAPFTLTATGGASGNPVTFASSNEAVATVSGTTATIVGAGITTITASQAGNANYNAASDEFQALAVDKAPQTIAFGALPAKNVGDADFAPGATASSTLTVSYVSSNTAVATIVGNMIHIVGAGSTDITASQAGNTNYEAAADVVQPLTVNSSGNPTLNVTISGNGSVNSAPSGIACTSGTCSADFTSGQSVDLTAATSWNHDFTGWSGACSGITNPCTVVVNSPTDVTATFTAKQLVKIGSNYYASMQDAYNAAVDGTVLLGRNDILVENLVFDRGVNVTFTGGNDDNWTVVGYTTVYGTVTIGGAAGGVTISDMIIQ